MKKENEDRQSKSVSYIPEGYHTVTPYLVANHAPMLIEFIQKAFDGEVTFITKSDDGKVMHATLKIGDSTIMISDTMPNMSPEPAMLFLYVEDVDSVFRKAMDARGISIQEPKDEFYGDRTAAVKDAWDNKWWIATHIEDVSPEELEKRAKEARKQQKEVAEA